MPRKRSAKRDLRFVKNYGMSAEKFKAVMLGEMSKSMPVTPEPLNPNDDTLERFKLECERYGHNMAWGGDLSVELPDTIEGHCQNSCPHRIALVKYSQPFLNSYMVVGTGRAHLIVCPSEDDHEPHVKR